MRFKEYPEFQPNLTPRQIFDRGAFGGTYFRPIYSSVNQKNYENEHTKYKFLRTIPENKLTKPFDEYDENLNKYKVRVGMTLEEWEEKSWIHPDHPYGWIQWYCDFYDGKRSEDDERQIKRWIRLAGPNGRIRKPLIDQIKKQKGSWNDFSISPKKRQTLLHWAFELTKKDMD